MHVLCASFGTRGDLAPFVAIGLALRAAGHRVSLCGPPDHAWAAARLPYTPAGDPYAAVIAELEAGPSRVMRVMERQVPAQFAALAPLVEQADLVLSGSMEYATAALCEHAGRPRRAVLLSPCMVPRRDAPMPMFPDWLPRWAAPWTWRLVELAAGGIRRLVDTERRRLGLGPTASLQGALLAPETWLPFPAALATVGEPLLAPVRQFDPWLLPPEPLPARVEAFLGAGPPPVYFGLGSMPGVPIELFAGVGRRALLAGEGSDRPDCCFVGEISHAALFPRCAAVVHHGGAGTTLTALRAGRPQLILPRTADQPFHGACVRAAGAGRVLPRKGLDPAKLAAVLAEVEALRPAPRPEDGIAEGVAACEALLR